MRLEQQDESYGNALAAAPWKGHCKVTELLLEHGAEANLPAGLFGNALQAAESHKCSKIVEILVAKDARPENFA
jgi:ankyrin repeat protein